MPSPTIDTILIDGSPVDKGDLRAWGLQVEDEIGGGGGGSGDFLQAGVGAITRTTQAKLRERISITDFEGVAPDNSTDCRAGIIKALTANEDRGGGEIYIPMADNFYYCSDVLDIKNVPMRIRGEAKGQGTTNNSDSLGSALRFPANKAGFRVQTHDTNGATTATSGLRADATIFDGIHMEGGGGTDSHLTSAWWLRARAFVMNCTANGWAGDGIAIIASEAGSGSDRGNANCCYVDGFRSTNNYNGIYLDGADANAYEIRRADCSNNRHRGFLDSSFLGGFFWGHMEGNAGGAWEVQDSNAITHIAAYVEPGQPASIAAAGTTWSGPQFGDVTGSGSGLRANGLDGGGYSSSNGFYTIPAAGQVSGFGRSNTGAIWDHKNALYSLWKFRDDSGDLSLEYGGGDIMKHYRTLVTRISKPFLSHTGTTTVGAAVGRAALYNADGTVAGYVQLFAAS